MGRCLRREKVVLLFSGPVETFGIQARSEQRLELVERSYWVPLVPT